MSDEKLSISRLNGLIWLWKTNMIMAQNREKGNTLIIALSLGLIMIGATSLSLLNSSKQETNAQSEEYTKQAGAVAEAGISRYQSFFVNHPKLTVYPDCEGPRDSNGVCPDTATIASWSNADSIPEVTSSTEITDAAQTSWQDVDVSDTSKGQFRLVSYRFDDDGNPVTAPDPTAAGVGTLIVEGRVNQTPSGTQNAATSTTRVEVSFDVMPGAGGNLNGEGLWITCNANSSTSNSGSEIQTNVKDSTSVSADNPPGSGTAACTNSLGNIAALKLQQKVNGVIPTPPFTYDDTS